MTEPSVVLSFDDSWVDAWHDWMPYFEEHGVRATFYISNMEELTDTHWGKLKHMHFLGHTIGHHGFRHLRPGAVGKVHPKCPIESAMKDFAEFIEIDIKPGAEAMHQHDIPCLHYSYPYGNRHEESDTQLLGLFKTLRIGGRGIYEPGKVPRIHSAYNFGKRSDKRFCGHEALLYVAAKDRSHVCFYMHDPVEHRIKWLVEHAKATDMKFATIEEAFNA